MGNTNIQTYIEENNMNISDNIFQVIKNDVIYTIKTLLEKKDNSQKIKISISCVFNNIFQVFEVYLDECPEIGPIENYEQIYQRLSKIIKDEKFEIVHENNNEENIIVKIKIDEKILNIKLLCSKIDKENKLTELTRNYLFLEKQYIQLKEKSEEKKSSNEQSMEIEDEENIKNSEDLSDENIHFNLNLYNNINNNITNFENSDENHISFDMFSSVWAMLKLNKIIYKENNENKELNLAAISFSNGKIIIININNLQIHQELKCPNTPYSLAQFKNDPNYLISSISNGQLFVYILKENKFEELQILQKPTELKKGEFNKVITLSDGNLLASDRGSLSIWKPFIEGDAKKFEFFKEIVTDGDTCHLVEVNPQVFACTIHSLRMIKVYKNEGNEYPLLGKLRNCESHGSNSNGMVRINDNLFCSGGICSSIYIVSINPVQVIQKIVLKQNSYAHICFLHKSIDGFIFTSIHDEIIQYKIIYDIDRNFIKLEIYDIISDLGNDNNAIFTTDDGKIFYNQRNNNNQGKREFFLTKYKQ